MYVLWAVSGVGALASVLLALWVFSEGPRNRAFRLFGWTTATVSLWGFLEFELRTAPDLAAALFGEKLLPLGWAWTLLLFFLFSLEFTRHPLRKRPWIRWLWEIPIFFIITSYIDSLLYRPPQYEWLGWAVRLWSTSSFGAKRMGACDASYPLSCKA